MKKTPMISALALTAMLASAGSGIEQFNGLGYGTLSGRLQTLSMYRDFENSTPDNAYASTLGLQLDYRSPIYAGWTVGASYIGVGVLNSKGYDGTDPGEALLGNGRVSVLNEGYLHYNMAALGLTNTTAYAGRRINNNEVFRADDYRQKSRAIEAIELGSKDVENTRLALGHTWKLSNWIDAGEQWEFRNYGDVFGQTYDTAGITWGEVVNKPADGLEVAVFDAIAYDVANLLGARAKLNVTDETAFLGYYRNEADIGRAGSRDSNVAGLSLEQKLGMVMLEGGYFGVFGDNLRFQETTTGINHALGASMMLYSGQFEGGANTLYAKVTTRIEQTKTTLYALYNVTRHDTDTTGKTQRMGNELNLAIKQPVPKIDNLTVSLKGGIGYRDGINGSDDTLGTDARVFLTYAF